ncbi:MAG TPA: molybdopterin converting factor subunit 1 [Polyangiaceae bacterium]|nr:molybdopterin converting factor subunit 1 [Polyangiaceae bacterium]
MTVTVLYFAGVRDLVGTAEQELTLPESPCTLQQFVAALSLKHPQLRDRLTGVRFAINETFSEPSDAIVDGDVVAVIPPVAGG